MVFCFVPKLPFLPLFHVETPCISIASQRFDFCEHITCLKSHKHACSKVQTPLWKEGICLPRSLDQIFKPDRETDRQIAKVVTTYHNTWHGDLFSVFNAYKLLLYDMGQKAVLPTEWEWAALEPIH